MNWSIRYLRTAFTIFVRQSVREGRIPFEVKLEYPIGEHFTATHGEKNNALYNVMVVKR